MVVTCAGNVATLANRLAGGQMISVTNTTSGAAAGNGATTRARPMVVICSPLSEYSGTVVLTLPATKSSLW